MDFLRLWWGVEGALVYFAFKFFFLILAFWAEQFGQIMEE